MNRNLTKIDLSYYCEKVSYYFDTLSHYFQKVCHYKDLQDLYFVFTAVEMVLYSRAIPTSPLCRLQRPFLSFRFRLHCHQWKDIRVNSLWGHNPHPLSVSWQEAERKRNI